MQSVVRSLTLCEVTMWERDRKEGEKRSKGNKRRKEKKRKKKKGRIRNRGMERRRTEQDICKHK